MMSDNSNVERYQRRVEERAFWVRVGWVLLISGFAILIFATIGTSFGLPFTLVRILDSISVAGVILGAIFGVLFSRVGWSKLKWIDLLLNRLSIVLITVSLIWGAISASLDLSLLGYAQVMLIIGIILAVLGIHFQSSVKD